MKNNKWQQEYSKKNKKIYESSRKLIAKRKDEKGKTKTELIKEFIDYEGDKWKYLMDHPLTRMALAVSGEPVFENITGQNLTMLCAANPLQKSFFDLDSWQFQGGFTTNAGYGLIMSSTQAITFPVQFAINFIVLGGSYTIAANIGFSTIQYGNASIPPNSNTVALGSNGNPFNANGANGFSIRVATNNQVSTTFSGMVYASTGITSTANIASLSETPIPGLATAPNFFLNQSNIIFFRFYSSGTKIGWSTDGLAWTYWNVPVPYVSRGLFLNLALSQLSSTLNYPGSPGYVLFKVPGTLVNAP